MNQTHYFSEQPSLTVGLIALLVLIAVIIYDYRRNRLREKKTIITIKGHQHQHE